MKLSTLLITPWRLTHRYQCWVTLSIFLLCIAVAIAIGHFDDDRHWWFGSTAFYCVGIAFFWALQMPHLLLVSIDARRLRAPGISQTVAWSIVVYAVLCVAVPVLVLTPLGANALAVALAVALTITACMAFALLPRYLLIICCFLLAISSSLRRLLPIPLPSHPGHATLAGWGVCALILLLLADALRWHTLSKADPDRQTGLHSPMVMQFVRDGTMSMRSGLPKRGDRVIRQIPSWLQVRADLRDVDPAHPARAIRMALGRKVMPLTLESSVRQWACAAVVLVFVSIVLLGEGFGHDAHALFGSDWFWLLMGGVIVAAVAGDRITVVQRQWSGTNAELALLALLPALGTPAEQKRHALHAILLQPLSWLLGALLACWVVVIAIHASPAIGVNALLFVLGSGGLLCTSAFGSLGGKPLGGFALGALFVTLLVLVGLTPGLSELPRVFHVDSASAAATLRRLFAAFWLVWLLVTGALAWRGWRGLQHRPHPFLANEP